MSQEIKAALSLLESEKQISKEILLDAIEQSLIQACKNHFGTAENVSVSIDRETCEFQVYAIRTVVETIEEGKEATQIPILEAQRKNVDVKLGDEIRVAIQSRKFGRIATQNAKNVILQKIREEERKVIYNEFKCMEADVLEGIVQRINPRNVSIDLGKADAVLSENEMIKEETLEPTQKIKVYILEVKDSSKGPRISVSRTHPGLVKRLFESNVLEIQQGIVEIKGIAREAGSRTKIAVWSNEEDVDPVGACVGKEGDRVEAVVAELGGEKIDIACYDENPGIYIENALKPAKVIGVLANPDEKTALVIVPDDQLSLAIGNKGQNVRLAARLTGYKIDIKSEKQAMESGDYDDLFYNDEEEDEEYFEEAEETAEEMTAEAADLEDPFYDKIVLGQE